MLDTNDASMDAMTRPARDAFEFWISFFPTAPLFGVPWRFAAIIPKGEATFGFAMPGADAPAAARATSCASARSREEAVEEAVIVDVEASAPVAEPAAEPVPSATAEPVAEPVPSATTEPAAEPVSAAEPAVIAEPVASAPAPETEGPATLMAVRPDAPSDLKLIKGIGPGLESQLNGLGVYTFEQMAAFSHDDLEWIDARLTSFKGRCFRDDWIGQARALID